MSLTTYLLPLRLTLPLTSDLTPNHPNSNCSTTTPPLLSNLSNPSNTYLNPISVLIPILIPNPNTSYLQVQAKLAGRPLRASGRQALRRDQHLHLLLLTPEDVPTSDDQDCLLPCGVSRHHDRIGNIGWFWFTEMSG